MSGATEPSLRALIAETRAYLEVQGDWGLVGLDVAPGLLRATQQKASGAPQKGTRQTPHQEARGAAGDAKHLETAPRLPIVVKDEASFAAPVGPKPSLEDVEKLLGDCTRCKLAPHRTHLVFGVGRPDAQLMIVGEAPGRDEDLQGEPFVGAAGQLLDRMLKAMGLSRQDVYIANMLKCRPPKNRFPEPDELQACSPFLLQQIRAVSPKVLLILGRCAAHALLKTSTPLGRLRGEWTQVLGIPSLVSFHPAYLLRNPADKKLAWHDLQLVMAALT